IPLCMQQADCIRAIWIADERKVDVPGAVRHHVVNVVRPVDSLTNPWKALRRRPADSVGRHAIEDEIRLIFAVHQDDLVLAVNSRRGLLRTGGLPAGAGGLWRGAGCLWRGGVVGTAGG